MLRLKTRSQFQAVLAGSKLAVSAHFAVHHLALDRTICKTAAGVESSAIPLPMFSHSDVWLGSMIPKRWAKRAVTRNAIKRQVFNVAREFESVLPLGAYVVRMRTGFSKIEFPSAGSEALKLSVRMELVQLLVTVSRPRATKPLQALAK